MAFWDWIARRAPLLGEEAAGRLGSKLLGPLGIGVAALTTDVGRAGVKNEQDLFNKYGTNSSTQSGSTSPTSSGSTTQSQDTGYGDGAYSGSNSGSTTPAYDPTPLRNEIRGQIQRIHDIYGQLFGTADQVAQDKRNQLDTNYQTQLGDLNRGFEGTSSQLPGIYAARGLGNSSYSQDAYNQAQDTYNRSLDQLNQGQQQNLASIGQYVDSTKGGFTSANQALDQINPDQYNDQKSLTSLRDQLAQQLLNTQAQQAGFGTQSKFVNDINSIAPTQQQGSQQLAKQLQTLVTSSAPQFAKKAIAKGLVKSNNITSPDAANYWLQYFENLLNQNGSATTPVA